MKRLVMHNPVAFILAILCVLVMLGFILFVCHHEIIYRSAERAHDVGNLEEALGIYEQLNRYKSSSERARHIRYELYGFYCPYCGIPICEHFD